MARGRRWVGGSLSNLVGSAGGSRLFVERGFPFFFEGWLRGSGALGRHGEIWTALGKGSFFFRGFPRSGHGCYGVFHKTAKHQGCARKNNIGISPGLLKIWKGNSHPFMFERYSSSVRS